MADIKARVILIRRTGIRAAFIRWLTISEWDHVGMIGDDGVIYDMTEKGFGQYRMEDRPDWRFKTINQYAKNTLNLVIRNLNKYSHLRDLAWMVALAGFKPKIFRHLSGTWVNNVTFVAQCFYRADWEYLPPRAFEFESTYANEEYGAESLVLTHS